MVLKTISTIAPKRVYSDNDKWKPGDPTAELRPPTGSDLTSAPASGPEKKTMLPEVKYANSSTSTSTPGSESKE